MANVWLMSDELLGLGNIMSFIIRLETVLKFCWTDWLRTIWWTWTGMDCYPTAAVLDVRLVIGWRLGWGYTLQDGGKHEGWFVLAAVCVAILSFRYDVTSLYTLFRNCPDWLFEWKRPEKKSQCHSVIRQKNSGFMYLFRKLEFPC